MLPGVSFCTGYVVISLQNRHESCLRHACIFPPFSWKGIETETGWYNSFSLLLEGNTSRAKMDKGI